MGKASRVRRQAKLKERERERLRRDQDRERSYAGGRSADQARGDDSWQANESSPQSRADAAEFLVGAALHAQVEGDKEGFRWCVAQFAGEGAGVLASRAPEGEPCWPRRSTDSDGWDPRLAVHCQPDVVGEPARDRH